jgi:two-component system OmpR family response regulator
MSMRILIIEDDREAASYLVKAFREAGYVADHAADGLDGYAMAEAGDYDVLVVDRMLPKLDGLSLIRSLREQKVETPVLILSALGQVDDRVKGLRAGGDDYLPKPYAFSELLARVEVLSRRRASAPSAEPTSTGSAISNSTACPTGSPAPARRSCCSRGSSGCSNT